MNLFGCSLCVWVHSLRLKFRALCGHVCVFVCASSPNLQIESVLLRLGSHFGSQKRLGERHEVKGQKEKDKNNKERISSSLKQIDNPDQSLMELEGKDQTLLCLCVCVLSFFPAG